MKYTLLADFLNKLDYRYTNRTIQEYQDSPLKDSFLGISETLSKLGIETEGYRLSDSKELSLIKTPVITIKNGKFAIISSISNNIIEYSIGKRSFIEDLETFSNGWSHSVLVVTDIHRFEETNYHKRKKYERNLLITKYFTIFIAIIVLTLFGFISNFWHSLNSVVLLIFNGIGLYFSTLLYFEYLDIESDTTQKICGLIKNSDCNKVSVSKGSKIFKLFHLSEIGCAFFLVNIIAIIIFNINISIISLVSICSLVFCIWSPLYQKFFVKKWCALCLLTVLILIIQFLFLLFRGVYGNVINETLNIYAIVILGLLFCSYALITTSFFYLSKGYRHYLKDQFLIKNYMEIKYNSGVAELLLNSEQKLSSDSNTVLVFGNPQSDKIITVVSNPFCISCIANHSELNKINLMDYRIEYVLTSFSEDLLYANHQIIAFYHKFGSDKTWDLLTKWYEDRNKQPSFFYDFNLNSEDGKDEVIRQLSWITKENIISTPSVFLNGKKLPIQYNVSDIPYFFWKGNI